MDKEQRPKLKLKITPLEYILNSLAAVLLISSTVYLSFSWADLPVEVPAHYNAVGEVDRWGSKWEMLILPLIAGLMWIGMTVLEKYPHVYNYMNLTKENVRGQYLNARLLVNVLKNTITIIFAYLTWKDIQVAHGTEDALGPWFVPVFFLLIYGPVIFFVIRAFRINR